jgi:hypothetical protein
VAGRKIVSVSAERQSTEDQFTISSKIFIDCTGDGRRGAAAGAPFRQGRAGKEEYNEPMALGPDKKTLGSTLLFIARKHDRPMPFIAPPWVRSFTEADLRLRPHGQPGVDRGLEYGYWWCEWGGQLDTIKDNEVIRDELLAIMLGVWNHIKNGGDHGAENWALDWFGFLPGKRESRRFIGQYVLSERDVFGSTPFDDAIAFGGWPIDTHPPEGVDAPDQKPCTQTRVPHLYDIPLRACISRDIDNLMFAGRNISATHIAFASTRVMATCAVIGQGAGTAAALASELNLAPAQLPQKPELIRRLQQQLLRDDAYLIGQLNADPGDLARQAKISASSQQETGPARNLATGQTRAVHGEKGAPPDRAHAAGGTHRWMSDPAEGLPAWVELKWDNAIRPRTVELIFDTGLHRYLTLSHSDAYSNLMQWGQPQEETVRDYAIELFHKGRSVARQETQGNYQRRRVHEIPSPQPADALRLSVTATNGLNHARVCEIRVYE